MKNTITLPFSEDQIHRYSRHILLKEIGGRGQQIIMKQKILVAGSLIAGVYALYYLAAAGVEQLYVYPEDHSIPNGQVSPRILVEKSKLYTILNHIKILNPDSKLHVLQEKECNTTRYNAVFNFCTMQSNRYLINAHCIQHRIHQFVMGFNGYHVYADLIAPDGKPCVECMDNFSPIPEQAPHMLINTIVPFFGIYLSLEVMKLAVGIGFSPVGYRMYFNSINGEIKQVQHTNKNDCTVCSAVV